MQQWICNPLGGYTFLLICVPGDNGSVESHTTSIILFFSLTGQYFCTPQHIVDAFCQLSAMREFKSNLIFESNFHLVTETDHMHIYVMGNQWRST